MERVVLFDGVCNFCNGSVNFIIARDKQKKFRFAPLQSEYGQQMRAKFNIGNEIDSIILIEDGHAYVHSAAALRIAKGLGGIWQLGYALIIVPSVIRDAAYKLFARYRYKIFGRQEACMLPTAEVRDRFMD